MGEEEYVSKCREAIKGILEIPEGERDEYVRGVLRWFKEMTGRVINAKGLMEKKRMWDKVGPEIGRRSPEIVACMMFTAKEEFRDEYMEIFIPMVALLSKD